VDFSVLIPTYNRAETLAKTLRALADQHNFAPEFEVLVIDDGSTDQTAEQVRRLQQQYPVPLHYFYQHNQKQGRARNFGARNASGRMLLFLGDDTVPRKDFLAAHHRTHEQQGSYSSGTSRMAVIGYTTWPDNYRRTRFLEYIGEQGWQFGFSLIKNENDVPFNFFYTSNLSLAREFFLKAGGFDESFHEYGWEDIELSLRLKNLGMRLVYCPEALTHHYHPISLTSFIQRQHKVGYSAWDFFRKHPEMAEFLSIDRMPRYRLTDHVRMRVLTWLCRFFEKGDWPDLSGYYPDLMSYYYMQGLIAGEDSERNGT
jgi:glycosyltransferase involved in cell wall biosynthesis